MPYITNSDLAIRYPLVNRWTGAGSATIVNSHLIYYAEGEINALLSPYFSVPFSSANVPAIVKDLTMDLCKVRILADQDAKRAEEIRKSVIDRIEMMKDGSLIGLDGSVILPSAPGAELWSSTMDYHPVHSMLDADNPYTRISSEQVYAEENERL